MEAATLPGGTWKISHWQTFERRGDNFKGNSRRPDPLHQDVDIAIYSLQLEHAPTPAWSFLLGLDYPSVEDQLDAMSENTRIHGHGDLALQARHAFTFLPAAPASLGAPHVHTDEEHSEPLDNLLWIATVGLSVPTGTVREPEMEGGISTSTLSRGTGTWDPILGLTAAVPYGGARYFGSATARIPAGENRFAYKTGGVRQASLGAFLPVWSAGPRPEEASSPEPAPDDTFLTGLALVPRILYVNRDADELDGRNVLASGGEKAYGVPGLLWKPSARLEVEVGARLPLWRDLDSAQLDSRMQWLVGVAYIFR